MCGARGRGSMLFMLLFAAYATRAQDHGVRVFEQVSGAVAWVQSVSPDSMHTLRGSGVVLKDRRWLVSNYPVWRNGGVLSARLGEVPLRLGRTITADRERDVLVVEVLGTAPESAWSKVPTLRTATSGALRPGMDWYALGNPCGVELTISHGLVSGFRLNLNDTANKPIQFSAPISEGNGDKQNARIEMDRALMRVMVSMIKDETELFKPFSDNPGFKRWLSDMVFGETYRQ